MSLDSFKKILVKDDIADTVQLWIVILLQTIIFALFITSLTYNLWLVAFTAFIVFILTFLPSLIQFEFGIFIPIELLLVNTVFLFASFALGEMGQFYQRIWWWDLMLHGFSAFILGLIGFVSVYVFYLVERISMRPFYIFFFSFTFAIALGTIWEVFEFLMDFLLGTNMMRSGLIDTMTDLMMNITGAFIASLIGFFYIKNERFFIVDRVIKKVALKNRKFSKKKRQGNQGP
jgi:hypothetical protein